MFEDDPVNQWRACRVLDVSSAGAGLQLHEADEDAVIGDRILLPVHLRGVLRNSGPRRAEGLRVGIQFVDLTDGELSYLESLAELQATW